MFLTQQSSCVFMKGYSMNGYLYYIAIYQGERIEVVANTLWEAKKVALRQLSIPKKKEGLLSIMLAEVNDTQYVHNTSSI